jgi:hypothetical protein
LPLPSRRHRLYLGEDGGVHRVAIPVRVDHSDPLGMAARHLVLPLGDAALELDSLLHEAVGPPPADPAGGPAGVDPEQEGEVGPDPSGGEIADLLDALGAQAPSDALIGDARVAEPVTDQIATLLAGRADDLRDELSASRAEEQQLRSGSSSRPGSLSIADPLARLVPPGSRTRTTSWPSAFASSFACGLSDPSIPSSEMNTRPG